MDRVESWLTEESSEELKTCSVFSIEEGRLLGKEGHHRQPHQPFRDPLALAILQEVVSGLRQQGYRLSEPKHGKATDAITECKFKNFSITVAFNVHDRRKDVVQFRLLTWKSAKPLRTFLHQENPSSSEVKEQWEGLRSALDRQLRVTTGAESIPWLTRAQAERSWSGAK
jgi:hypothetical protein